MATSFDNSGDNPFLKYKQDSQENPFLKYAQPAPLSQPLDTPEAQKEAGILDRISGATQRIGADISTGAQALFASDEEKARLALENLQRQQEISREMGTTRGFSDVAEAYEEGILPAAGEVLSQAPGLIAEQIPQSGGLLTSAALGSAAGSVIPGVGTVAGGLIGSGLYLYSQFFGSAITEQAAQDIERGEEVDINTTRAALAAAGQSAIEAVGGRLMFGKGIVNKVLGREITEEATKEAAERELVKAAQRSLSGTMARGAVRGAAEMPVEVAQEVLNRWQSEQDLLSDDAYEAYTESAYAGLVAGSGIGSLTGPFDRGAARSELAKRGLTPEGKPIQPSVSEDEQEEVAPETVESTEEDLELDAEIEPAVEAIDEVELDETGRSDTDTTGAGVDVSGESAGDTDTGVLDETDTAGVPSTSVVEPVADVGEGVEPAALTEEVVEETAPVVKETPAEETAVTPTTETGAEPTVEPTTDIDRSVDFITWLRQKGVSLTDPSQDWPALEAQWRSETTAVTPTAEPTTEAKPTTKAKRTTKAKPVTEAEPITPAARPKVAELSKAETDVIEYADSIGKKAPSVKRARKIAKAVGIPTERDGEELGIDELNPLIASLANDYRGVQEGRLIQVAPRVFQGATQVQQQRSGPERATQLIGPVMTEGEQTRRAMREGIEQDKTELEALETLLDESYERNPVKSIRLKDDPSRPEVREEYELAREEAKAQDMAFEVPAWEKLSRDEKYIFLGALPQNATALDYTRAIGALEGYRGYIAESGFEKAERDAIAGYEEARPTYSRVLGANLPRWGDLSEQARLAYLDVNKNNSPVQQDAGMMAIANTLDREGILNMTDPAARERRRLRESERLAQVESVRRAEREAREAEQQQATQEAETTLEAQARFAPQTEAQVQQKLEKYPSDAAVQAEINEGGTLSSILGVLAERARSRRIGALAEQLNRLVRQIGVQNLDAKFKFGSLKEGADGQFDPETNTITIAGVGGQYTGDRSLTEVVMHEIMHLLTDHVIDNRQAYLKTIPDARKRQEVTAALNRLNQNFNRAKSNLGKEFNIPTIKEFIAEAFSNQKFQTALIELDRKENLERVMKGRAEKVARPRNVLDTFRQFAKNVAQALGITPPESAPNFKDVLDDVAQIISFPTTAIRGEGFSYAEAKKDKKPAKKAPKKDVISLDNDNPDYRVENTVGESTIRRALKKTTFTRAAEMFQNARQRVRNWEEKLRLAGKIDDTGDKFTNIFTQVSLAIGRGEVLFKENIQDPVSRVHGSLNKVMKAIGKDADGTLQYLQKITEALHEPERRQIKYLMNVPLRVERILSKGGKRISPADRRTQIVNLLQRQKRLTDAQVKSLRNELDALVAKYKDELGYSPLRSEKNTGKMPIDINDDLYNVSFMDAADSKRVQDEYESNTDVKPVIDEFLESLRDVQKASAKLDRQANYWSDPVDNFVRFYDWKNYIPLKGTKKGDELLDFNSKKMGRELQELTKSFEGRGTVANNTIMQVLSDATRAAARAGRVDYVQSIYNAVDQGLIPNAKIKERIKFEDRDTELRKAKKDNSIFKYNKDGSVDVIEFSDLAFLEGLRKTYKEANPLINIMNRVTGFFGQMHTRYNYAFAPLNFVRDTITNAFVVSGELSPKVAAQVIGSAASKVSRGGLYKALRVAAKFEKGDIAGMRELAKKDSFYKDLVEYIDDGGAVSYIQSLGINDRLTELALDVEKTSKGRIIRSLKQVEDLASIYNNAFEFAARAAAYGVLKKHFKKTENLSEKAAITRTTAYVKNFANFEQVGEWGRALGAFFMFFRPAATGAVRAIETVMPAFISQNRALRNLPPAVIQDAKALATFKKNYRKRQENARVTAAGLFGLGVATYFMSAMMADDDDDLGRNPVLFDNMDQWERYARFHIPRSLTEAAGIKEPLIFQMPWGFGLGAFAAAGGQMGAVMSGNQSATDAMANIFLNIAMDSYLPLPVSRMDPTEYPMQFALDSIMPSAARPLVQFVMNKDGLGRGIYPESFRRVVDAYTSSNRVPTIYQEAAKYIFNESGGDVDVNANALYFLANSYVDGASRLVHDLYGAYQLASGEKAFVPKNDTFLFSSFFGAKSNIESRDFARVENKLREKAAVIKAIEGRPEVLARRLEKYPLDPVIVQMYNHDINQALRDLRSEAKRINQSDFSPKTKTELLRSNYLMQRVIKRNLLDKYKAYNIEP